MKTFALQVSVGLRIAVSAEMLTNLRAEASFPPDVGGDVFLHDLNKRAGDDDEAFLQGVLTNGLRKLIGASLKTDLRTMGVQATVEPAVVTSAYLKPPEKPHKKAQAVIVGTKPLPEGAAIVLSGDDAFVDTSKVPEEPVDGLQFGQEGDKVYCIGADFVDPQVSAVGYGKDAAEAEADYREQLLK